MESSDWIAVTAAAVSLFALAVSVYEAMSNKPRLRISASFALSSDLSQRLLALVIVNHGRQPTVITHVSIVTKGRKETIAVSSSTEEFVLPHLLEVGRVATFVVPLDRRSDDPFNIGKSDTLAELFAEGRSRIMVRNSWHAKPQYVSVS
tara:strand:- start:4 stop:450 length:447 start_codon:yes stop_codon:yes gene_type:complete